MIEIYLKFINIYIICFEHSCYLVNLSPKLKHLLISYEKYYTIYEMHSIQNMKNILVKYKYIFCKIYISLLKLRKPDALLIYRFPEVQVIINI